jgi:hypothetical protein
MLVLASAVILRSDCRRTRDHILLSQIRDSRNLEGQVPVSISPRKRVTWLYPQTLGSLFVASYVSQGYGAGIRTRFHAGLSLNVSDRPYYLRVEDRCNRSLRNARKSPSDYMMRFHRSDDIVLINSTTFSLNVGNHLPDFPV